MKAAVMGYGTVGKGVCDILTDPARDLRSKCGGTEVTLAKVLDIRDLSATPAAAYWTKEIGDIIDDPQIGVVAETMGGLHPAFEFCMRCLESGKNVVTSNKQLVAEKGEILFETAKAHNVSFRFGAAVCGGVPVIRTLFYGMAANQIESFSGILNGTTNFILTKMIREQITFDEALRQAQEKGYAERDPSADVDGPDACRKTAILASAAFGTHVYPEEIHTEGITGITMEDVSYADGIGRCVKLLGRAQKLADGRIYAIVSPALVKKSSMLAAAEGVYNAVRLTGDQVGDLLFYGRGAGREATASAVVADILDGVRLPGFDGCYVWGKHAENRILPYEERALRLYVRGYADDKAGAAARIRTLFDGAELLSGDFAPDNEIAFLTGTAKEKELRALLARLEGFTVASVIRTED